uniref:Uncharacterized protein n=1 Tax=Mesocestoides corti TaxID=53468 RepID=A0A5K3ESY1_MESCO
MLNSAYYGATWGQKRSIGPTQMAESGTLVCRVDRIYRMRDARETSSVDALFADTNRAQFRSRKARVGQWGDEGAPTRDRPLRGQKGQSQAGVIHHGEGMIRVIQ